MNLEDIAKKAGVSRSTVSRVINANPNVRPHVREHVQDIIRQENFQPNHLARALVKRQTEIIGLVVPTADNILFTDNNYLTQILAGISRTARDHNYALLLWLIELSGDEDKFMQNVSHNHLMDGIIIASLTRNHPMFDRLINFPSPVVLIDRPIDYADRLNYVSIDNMQAADDATTHLIRLGRTRIAHITGHMAISDARDRLEGYKRALRRAGLPIDDSLIMEGAFSRQVGYEKAKQLLPLKPDAIFAASDTIAIGVLQAAHEAGLAVPDDLSLVGFDDVDVATQSIPMLTTVRQPLQDKGAAAAELLIDMVKNRVKSPRQTLLKTELVIRQSCGASRVH